MRHFWICGCVLLVAACAGGENAGPSGALSPPPQRQGPKIVTHEAVDWTPLNPIVAIRLDGLKVTEQDDLNGISYYDTKIELQIFPSVKSISFDAVPWANGGVGCIERGQSFVPQLIASPGADVSDRMTCVGQSFWRSQVALNYSTTAKFLAGTLAIDGKARIVSDQLDDGGRAKARMDYAIEMHGVIQISGTKCRVVSWQHDFPEVTTFLDPANSLRKLTTVAAVAGTTCTVITEKTAN